MIAKKRANVLRFILGIVIALFAGFDSFQAGRGLLITFLLPCAILLLVISDLIAYLSARGVNDKP